MGERHEQAAADRRLRGIEGLRGIAALSVLLYHVAVFVKAPGGGFANVSGTYWGALLDLRGGLTLFFVLSGFLLYRPVAAALVSGRALPRVRPYLRNRVLRIVPAYWVVLLLAAFVLQTTVVAGQGVGRLDDPVQLLACMFLVQPYSPSTVYAGLGPDWSLSVEALFYVLMPLLGAAAAVWLRRTGRGPRRRLAAALAPAATLVTLGLVVKVVWDAAGPDAGRWGPTITQTLPLSADLFGYGMAAAVVHVLVQGGTVRIAPALRRLLIPAALALGLAVVLWAGRGGLEPLTLQEALLGVACAVLLLAVTLPGPSRLGRLLDLRLPVWAGLCSYSVYLWHMPVVFFLVKHGLVAEGSVGVARAFALALPATLVLAVPTYLLVERPALRRKRRLAGAAQAAPATPASGAALEGARA